jgi:hypothetical protein
VIRPGPVAAILLAGALVAGAEAAPPPAPTSEKDAAPAKKASLFKDPEDGAFDIGGWIATRTGVIPILFPITEPAVGYGAALGLILIHGGSLAGLRGGPSDSTSKV